MTDREALEEMVWQFAYRIVSGGRRALDTGGLSALEGAFAALGWEEPHVVDPADAPGCDEPGCPEWAEAFLAEDGKWCWKHGKERAKPCAPA